MAAAVFFLSFLTITLAIRKEPAAFGCATALFAFIILLRKKFTLRQQKHFYLILLGGIAGGFTLSMLRLPPENTNLPSEIHQQRAIVLQVSPRSAIIEFSGSKIKTRLTGLAPGHALIRGDIIQVSCRPFTPPESIFRKLEELQHIKGMCQLLDVQLTAERSPWSGFFLNMRNKINSRLGQALQAGTLAAGVLLADTNTIEPYELSMYRHMGIAHLFAASGLHLGLMFGIFFLPFRLVRRPFWGLLCGFVASTFFLLLLEAPVSLVRAYIFLLFFLLSELTDRKVAREAVLFLAAIFAELLYPYSTFSLAFILSFAVTGSILLFFPYLRRLFAPVKIKPLADHLALTVAAFSASALLAALFFGGSGPVSLLYNFVAVPAAAIYLSAVILAIFIPAAAHLVSAGDSFYKTLAWLHSQTIYAYLPPLPDMWNLFWGTLVFFLVLWFWYRARYHTLWSARKIPLYGLPALLVLYYLPLAFNPPLPQAARALPGMVWEYRAGELLAQGEPAQFLYKEPHKIIQLPEWPVQKIYLPDTLHSLLPPLLYSKVRPQLQNKAKYGLLRGQLGCYLFFSSIEPQHWQAQELATCERLFLVLSQKDRASNHDLAPVLRHFGYGKTIITMGYFQWQEIAADSSDYHVH